VRFASAHRDFQAPAEASTRRRCRTKVKISTPAGLASG
jgi:hypothetical protein